MEGKRNDAQPDARPRLVKLVRDEVAKFLGGSVAFYNRVPEQDREDLLRQKLGEEVVEYLLVAGRSDDLALGELADIYSVSAALARAHGSGMAEVHDRAAAKDRERGGFDEGIGMYVTTTAPFHHEGEHA